MAAQPGKILHVFDHSFPIGDGYANRSGEIVRFSRQAGWNTVHVTSSKQGATAGNLETMRGLEFHRTQPSRSLLARVPMAGQWSVVSTLRRRLHELVRAERPGLLHVHSPCLNALAAIPVARKFGLPVIYEVRALWEDGAVDRGDCREGDLRYRMSRWLETNACSRVDHIITICEGLKTDLRTRGLNDVEITVAPNSVDLRRFGAPPERNVRMAHDLGLTEGKTFGFIGSFFPFEGLEILLRAVSTIRSAEPHARFLIVGDGIDAERLRGLARELAIEQAVTFTGRVPHEQVEQYYGLIDVLIYPRISNRVTELVTPLKPLEAMAQGKLVVASDVGGHREMVFHARNGMLFKSGDPASLAQTCIELLRRPEGWQALREGGRTYVASERSWERNAGIYSRLYERYLQRSAAPAPAAHV